MGVNTFLDAENYLQKMMRLYVFMVIFMLNNQGSAMLGILLKLTRVFLHFVALVKSGSTVSLNLLLLISLRQSALLSKFNALYMCVRVRACVPARSHAFDCVRTSY